MVGRVERVVGRPKTTGRWEDAQCFFQASLGVLKLVDDVRVGSYAVGGGGTRWEVLVEFGGQLCVGGRVSVEQVVAPGKGA